MGILVMHLFSVKRVLTSLSIIVACLVTSTVQATEYEGCYNCSAEVTLPYARALQLIEVVRTLSSMPLDGRLTFVDDSPAPIAKVEIGTFEEYAQINSLDSFDIAKRLMSFAASSEWEITSIEAKVEFADRPKNAGTIGH